MIKVSICSESSELLGKIAQIVTLAEGKPSRLFEFSPQPFCNLGNASTFFEKDKFSVIDEEIFDELKKSIANIVNEKQTRAILVCSLDSFKYFVSTRHIKPNLTCEDNHTILSYASIGEDKCILLIAFDNEYYRI